MLNVNTYLLNSLNAKSDLFTYLHHLQSNNDYTFSHSLNVSLLCNMFAGWLKLSKSSTKLLIISALLHDIGKIRISKSILDKPGKLTREEFKEIYKHPIYGYTLIKDINIDDSIKCGILMHHERIDGSGYPQKLLDENIHDYGKIIAIVDIYDAMTSERSYHKKHSPFKVINMFEHESFGILDTKFLYVFLNNIAHNYLGKTVMLSTGEYAKIIFIHNQAPSKPIVQVRETMVDLLQEPTISIDQVL